MLIFQFWLHIMLTNDNMSLTSGATVPDCSDTLPQMRGSVVFRDLGQMINSVQAATKLIITELLHVLACHEGESISSKGTF